MNKLTIEKDFVYYSHLSDRLADIAENRVGAGDSVSVVIIQGRFVLCDATLLEGDKEALHVVAAGLSRYYQEKAAQCKEQLAQLREATPQVFI